MRGRFIVAAGLLGVSHLAGANEDFLPDPAQVRVAIDARPEVMAAHTRREESAARGEALSRGDYGYELTVMPLTRHDTTLNSTWAEVEAMLTRRFRLPAKVRLDRSLGALGEESAALALADARHLAARVLLRRWMDWLRAAGAVVLAERQRNLTAQERAAVRKRVTLGDLAELDGERADAALAQTEVDLARATHAREQARVALAHEFPALGLPAEVPQVPPPPNALPSADDVVAEILTHSHEIGIARTVAARQSMLAQRLEADRIPDPSLGLRMLDESQGSQKSLSLVVMIPFAAPSLAPRVTAERREAEALVEDTNTLIRDRTVEARQLAEGLPLLAVAWRASATSAAAAASALARMNRAWALGEAGFSDLALARRAAFEADAAELGARLDMHAALLQVDIDTHTLWVTEPHGSDLSEGPPLER
jgi:cobalt-zinc-cadmium efflux system outer membrane protein